MGMSMEFIRKLPTPSELKAMYPLDENLIEIKAKNDEELRKIFTGESDKFLLIIGPCSADREDAVVEYMHKLRDIYEKVKDVIFIVPRIYTNKPRTSGTGYKGMLHQPDPKKEEDMLKGLIAIRKMHMKVLEETHFSCADEMLYPENHKYLDDLLSYVAVGARSVEDQIHRLTASGLGIPTGMKNPTSGDVAVMLNAINAAQHAHTFIYRGWEVKTKGNEFTHAILRGYQDEDGRSIPNYHYETLNYIANLYDEKHFKNPAIIVDCNHCNSNKQCLEQVRIAKEVMHSVRVNPSIKNIVKGLMIESYLVDGNQKVEEGVYGKSITDPCLGIEKTEELLLDLAKELRDIKNEK
ncbi:MAG: 3-deoxy-7-phosphoheptulonate synthase [Gammaproteobacteria bacterium]|nr:3-deoxy-7-phosphoheptulonate synthase [Gammaproteobacteria bacterium]